MKTAFWHWDQQALILSSIALMWGGGFVVTRITKRLRLPNVTGYIFAGILLGPYVLGWIPEDLIHGMDFLTDVTLAFIAFGVGRYLKMDRLKKSGMSILWLTFAESIFAAVVVCLTMLLFGLSLPFSLLLGAIASATAPASSLMTIRQYRAKGKFVDTLVQVVALDDAISLLAFSLCAAIAAGAAHGNGFRHYEMVILPLLKNIAALVAATILGFALSGMAGKRRSDDHRLALACTALFLLAALCAAMDVSPLLGCMLMGMLYANRIEEKKLFKQLNRFTPPLYVLFFVLSGMRLNLSTLSSAGIIGVTYFIVRIIGKYLGARIAAKALKMPENVQKYLGLALIPQAGVSIGLAILAQRLLPPEAGTLLSTIILSSSVLYEMLGPAAARHSLVLAGAIPKEAFLRKDESLHLPISIGPAKEEPMSELTQDEIDHGEDDDAHWNWSGAHLWPMRREEEDKRIEEVQEDPHL